MPDLSLWQWLLGVFSAFMIGIAKTGVPGAGTLVVPLLVLTVGDARYAAAWMVPILLTGDLFAVLYWRRHTDARKLFSFVPWVAVGMVAGSIALSLPEQVLRRVIGSIVVLMLVLHIWRRRNPSLRVAGAAPLYGISAGFATTIANAAGPVMNMYLLTRGLSKEQFVATGAWFFLIVNLSKVPIYAWYDLFSRASLIFDFLMIPAVICGAFVGLVLVRRLPQHVFEMLIIVLTAISSIFLFR